MNTNMKNIADVDEHIYIYIYVYNTHTHTRVYIYRLLRINIFFILFFYKFYVNLINNKLTLKRYAIYITA